MWAARFFKTRGAAAKAVSGGKVQVHSQRAKPAKLVRVGDELRVRRGIYEYVITVDRITHQRRPAREAQLMYTESEESAAERQRIAAQRKAEAAARADLRDPGRPTKKQRRQLLRLTRGE